MRGELPAQGGQLQLNLVCSNLTATIEGKVGVDVLVDSTLSEYVRIGFDFGAGHLFVDQSHLGSGALQTTTPLPTSRALTVLNLTVLVDGALIESFLNDRLIISTLLAPSEAGAGSDSLSDRGVRAFSSCSPEASCEQCNAQVWPLLLRR